MDYVIDSKDEILDICLVLDRCLERLDAAHKMLPAIHVEQAIQCLKDDGAAMLNARDSAELDAYLFGKIH